MSMLGALVLPAIAVHAAPTAKFNPCTVSIQFDPSAAISSTAQLLIATDTPGSPHIVALKGKGIEALPEASDLGFHVPTVRNQLLGSSMCI